MYLLFKSFFSFFVLLALTNSNLFGATSEDWCIENPTTPPCQGKPGRCTLNRDGSPGGFVAESAYIETQADLLEPSVRINLPYLGRYAQVCEMAWVVGRASVTDKAKIFGNARVSGRAQVYGLSQIFDRALITGDSQVYGKAWISGNAWIKGHAQITDSAWIFGHAQVDGVAYVAGTVRACGHAVINETAHLDGYTWITGRDWINGTEPYYQMINEKNYSTSGKSLPKYGIWF